MTLSSNQLQALGKRLRQGDPTDEDLFQLEEFRREFDRSLLNNVEIITHALAGTAIPFLISGRAKRTKSILRKLRRPNNKNMDLSRIDDIVGLRLITLDAEHQQRALEVLTNSVKLVRDPYDYRLKGPNEYRAIHLVLGEPSRRVELQIRTCAQHYWADVCESFGEQAKEGNPTQEHFEILKSLGEFCIMFDKSDQYLQINNEFGPSLDRLCKRFHEQTNINQDDAKKSYVVVFDSYTNQSLRCAYFQSDDKGRNEALNYYREQNKKLASGRYEVLVLNSDSPETLRITHPRFFPE
jgi:ppGpp synthetase/RelA/SpoT-type nucleotidyltranferase